MTAVISAERDDSDFPPRCRRLRFGSSSFHRYTSLGLTSPDLPRSPLPLLQARVPHTSTGPCKSTLKHSLVRLQDSRNPRHKRQHSQNGTEQPCIAVRETQTARAAYSRVSTASTTASEPAATAATPVTPQATGAGA